MNSLCLSLRKEVSCTRDRDEVRTDLCPTPEDLNKRISALDYIVHSRCTSGEFVYGSRAFTQSEKKL